LLSHPLSYLKYDNPNRSLAVCQAPQQSARIFLELA